MRRIMLAGALCAALPFAAGAADAEGRFAIKGTGISSCQMFLNETEKRSHNSFLFAGWLNGYLTAVNQSRADTFDATSWESLDTLANYLAHYCRKHPEKSFFIAVTTMLDALMEQRLRTFTPKLRASAGGNATILYQEVLRRAQVSLAERGYYQGEPVGLYDTETHQALEAFQKAEGLDTHGLPDQRTLHRLLVNNALPGGG